MTPPRRTSLIAGLVLLGCAVAASADPIRAVYSVDTSVRYSYQTETAETFNQHFQLRLTFDPATGVGSNSYGYPHFSAIPLALPDVPSDLTTEQFGFTDHHSGLPGDGAGYFQYALARQITQTPSRTDLSEREFYRVLSLESFVEGLATPPDIRAETFAQHLGIPNYGLDLYNTNFLYAGYLHTGPVGRDGNYAPNSYAYYGNAQLLGFEPVPEPATIFLAGTGLAAIARRRLGGQHSRKG